MKTKTMKNGQPSDKLDTLVRRKITDCEGAGCEKCDVCKRLHLIECSGQCGVANSIEQDREIDAYIKNKYEV